MALVAGALGLSLGGCVRDPLDWECPAIDPGDLVVTELRGPQTGADAYDQWIEIYNRSGTNLDLYGTQIWLQRLDGGAEGRIIIRLEGTLVGVDDYLVVGRSSPTALPAHLDYGYMGDFSSDFYNGGAVDILACGQRIDRVIYRDLPSRGTLALDGAIDPPDAQANDDETAWCQDENEGPDSDELGIRGTPGEDNITCP